VRASWILAGVSAIWVIGASGPAVAQETLYKCGAHSYSSKPCSGKVVNSEDYRARAKKGTTVHARRLPGESDADFAVRSRRANLKPIDQDECKRLDTKIPFEQERLKRSVTADETAQAQTSIDAARKRFGQLGC
jgi:hypothetical protein